MKKVIFNENCNNAPKKKQIYELYENILLNKLDIIDYVHEDLIWNIKGKETLKGLKSVPERLRELSKDVVSIELENIITHGRVAAANGIINLSDNTIIDFCDTFTFNNSSKTAKIKVINSYYIKERK